MKIFERMNRCLTGFIATVGIRPNAILLGEKEWGELESEADKFCTIKDPALKGKRSTFQGCNIYMIDAERHLACGTIYEE